jgi:hypothetical protein
MVNREHIDVLVKTALEGPSGVPVSPDSALTGFPLRWYARSMSDEEAIDRLGSWQVCRDPLVGRPGEITASHLGQILIDANVRSIHARYPDTIEGGQMPGPIEPYWEQPYVYADPGIRLSPAEAFKAISCFIYQACEFETWWASEASQILDSLHYRVASCVKGYDEAPWGWDAEDLAKAKVLHVTGHRA